MFDKIIFILVIKYPMNNIRILFKVKRENKLFNQYCDILDGLAFLLLVYVSKEIESLKYIMP